MPTVLRFAGLRVVIYYNDHRPAHVHAIGHGCEAVLVLNCPCGPVVLRENYGFARAELSRIAQTLNLHVEELCQEWRKLHDFP